MCCRLFSSARILNKRVSANWAYFVHYYALSVAFRWNGIMCRLGVCVNQGKIDRGKTVYCVVSVMFEIFRQFQYGVFDARVSFAHKQIRQTFELLYFNLCMINIHMDAISRSNQILFSSPVGWCMCAYTFLQQIRMFCAKTIYIHYYVDLNFVGNDKFSISQRMCPFLEIIIKAFLVQFWDAVRNRIWFDADKRWLGIHINHISSLCFFFFLLFL